MNIHDCMKHKVISIASTASIVEAASIFVKQHIGLLPVLDEQGKPIGMVRLGDLLSLELPDFVRLLSDVDFVHDFGAVETTRPAPELLAKSVRLVMQPVITVYEDSGLLHAYALMLAHDLVDLTVVNSQEKLVGIVSRVDIGTAVLSIWGTGEKVS